MRKSLSRSKKLFQQLRQDNAGGSGHSPVDRCCKLCEPWICSQSCAAKLPGDLVVENERTKSELASGLQAPASGREGLSLPKMGKVEKWAGLAGTGKSVLTCYLGVM